MYSIYNQQFIASKLSNLAILHAINVKMRILNGKLGLACVHGQEFLNPTK